MPRKSERRFNFFLSLSLSLPLSLIPALLSATPTDTPSSFCELQRTDHRLATRSYPIRLPLGRKLRLVVFTDFSLNDSNEFLNSSVLLSRCNDSIDSKSIGVDDIVRQRGGKKERPRSWFVGHRRQCMYSMYHAENPSIFIAQ